MDGDTAMTEPSDWPSKPPGLRCLDESMRCRICGDMYKVPVSLRCGHCYCSHCIREYIGCKLDHQEAPLCPICRSSCDESHITPQPVLRDIVTFFSGVRQHLICAAYHTSASSHGDRIGTEVFNASENPSVKGASGMGKAAKRRCTSSDTSEGGVENMKDSFEPIKPKIPSKLCFNVMNAKQVKKEVCSLGLRGDGNRAELERRYQAFRRHVATAVDAGRCLSTEALAREFNCRVSRAAFVRTMNPRRPEGLNVTNYSFRDLLEDTKSRMRPVQSVNTEASEKLMDPTVCTEPGSDFEEPQQAQMGVVDNIRHHIETESSQELVPDWARCHHMNEAGPEWFQREHHEGSIDRASIEAHPGPSSDGCVDEENPEAVSHSQYPGECSLAGGEQGTRLVQSSLGDICEGEASCRASNPVQVEQTSVENEGEDIDGSYSIVQERHADDNDALFPTQFECIPDSQPDDYPSPGFV